MSAQYPVVPVAAGTLARVLGSVLSLVILAAKNVERAMRHRREANVLARLDRHMLADIGITRADVADAFSSPLWQDPTELLKERVSERRQGRSATRKVTLTVVEPGFQQPPTSRPARQTV